MEVIQGGQPVIAHLFLVQSHSFAKYFQKLEKNLGGAQNSEKKIVKKVMMEEKLHSINCINFILKIYIILTTVSYGYNKKRKVTNL